jgi:ParB family chromosome partitioning protein
MASKSSLGLKAFTGVVQGATQRAGDSNIPIDLIDVEPQVRTQFDDERQKSINASIAAQGINQSLVLLAKPDGRYRLIAGEYRYRGALANKLTEVPARVRTNLADWEIRRIQVSENMERTDISAYDEARGVSQDVEEFGVPKAMEIWNRSEGWISKRTSALKYAEEVRALLKDGTCGDLEIAHSLNQIYAINQDEFRRMVSRLREGIPLSRVEARGKVQQVKEWEAERKQREERRQSLEQANASAGRAKGAGKAGDASGAATDVEDTASAATGGSKRAIAKGKSRADATSKPAAAEHMPASADHAAANDAREPAAIAVSKTPLTQEQREVIGQMVSLFENGLTNRQLLKDVQNELAEIGADMNQSEWAMWSLFQTALLPMLDALGEARSQRYLQRMIADLRTNKPQALWDTLHPTAEGASDDWSTARTTVAPMPKDWRF